MPQEIVVWYILPAIRRELALIMIARGIPQKHIARMLGVTEPAVTQYKLRRSDSPKRSRGDQIEIPEELHDELERAADRIIAEWESKDNLEDIYETMTREFNRLLKLFKEKGILCDAHRNHTEMVKDECHACKEV